MKKNQQKNVKKQRGSIQTNRNTSAGQHVSNSLAVLRAQESPPVLTSDQIVQLQRTTGNRNVNRLISNNRSRPAQVQRDHHNTSRTLSEALGYQPMVERIANMSGSLNPLTASILRRTTSMLEARIVRNDGADALALYQSLHGTFNNFRLSLARIGDTAPNRFLWSAEESAWRILMGRIESQIRMGLRGGWSDGRDSYFMNLMQSLDGRFINQMITPMSGPSLSVLPGGSLKQKIPLGTIPSPIAIITVYLILKVSRSGDQTAGGGQATGGVTIGEDGNISGGNLGTQASGPGGSQISGQVSQDGPQVAARSGQSDIGGGSTAQTSVQATPTSAEGTLQIQNPNGWTSQMQFTSGGDMTYQIQHSSGSGMSLGGTMAGVTLQAMAPTLALGNVNVESSIELSVIPAPQLWRQSLTQTSAMLSYARAYYGTLAALSLIPVSYAAAAGLAGVGSTAGAGAAAAEASTALPSISATFGRMVLAL